MAHSHKQLSKYILCKFHDWSIVSVVSFVWRTLQDGWRTTVLLEVKFRVSASETSLMIANLSLETPQISSQTFARTFDENKERN